MPTAGAFSADIQSGAAALTGNINPDKIGEPDDGRVKQKPRVEDLGNRVYRIGSIKVDKAKRTFTVPGVMLPHEKGKAIEFIASTRQGYKSYESVFALEANAFEFNLACILIGLDAKQAVLPKFHFDPEAVKGNAVSINVGWEVEGKSVDYDVVALLKDGDSKPAMPSVWSYTGSQFIEGDRYLAQMDGVLIGLSHDPASIIEHREGLGLGNWGSVTIDADLAPPNGQGIILKVLNREGAGHK
jgi:hypothetical protein